MNKIIFGDVLQVLDELKSQNVKVQTCITSPPYYKLRSYLPEEDDNKHLEIGNEKTPDEYIDFSNCRVVTPENPDLAWRGDRIASSLQRDIIDMFGNVSKEISFYDLMILANEPIPAKVLTTNNY
jgi:hypothetical protein